MSSRLETNEHVRRLVIAPNGSLSVAQAQWFFVGMCAVSFGIAGFMTVFGLWLIWPFAGLEMAALGAGLYVSLRDNGYREVVSVYDDRIEVEAGLNEPQRRWEFPRLLTQVRLSPGQRLNSPSRLLVTRHGHGCELGRCLTDEERAEVAERLKAWVTAPRLT
ncbi:DUF2244 domain-containing protein [Salinisphaera aquimarina]|uniref:DUF2244 domain-containing protein n=1 Tax=Salinisphaera aquimarina TaxID=2094031 RepID=A0ABV7EJ38_9GAMM